MATPAEGVRCPRGRHPPRPVIVSRARRYVFVHIPKTGGTALALALEARAAKDDILFGDTPKARARAHRQKALTGHGRLWKHSTLADIDGLVTARDLDDWFVLTLVRNPWDRVLSYYVWLRTQRFDHPAVRLAAASDFSAFLAAPETRASLRAHPSEAYLRDASGRLRCTLWLRLEHLDRDIAPFEAHLGFRIAPVAAFNRTHRDPDWRPSYSDADAALVADLCAPDIARFGYRFDDPVLPRRARGDR